MFCPIIHLVISQYQLLLSQKVTLLCPIIYLVTTQISSSPVPKKHIVMSHNSSQRDPKLTSPVPKNHLVQSQNPACYDHKSTSPVPKSDLILSHILSCYDVILSSLVPKVTWFCPIICLIGAFLKTQRHKHICPFTVNICLFNL